MEYYILAIGTGLLGAFLGLIFGFFTAKHMGLTPSAKELQKALEISEDRYKSMNSRWRGRIKEYEQPSELQRIANSGAEGEDMISMLTQNIGGFKIPTWVRPFLPAIQSYIKENPDKVQALIQRFISKNAPNISSNTNPQGEDIL